MKKGINPNQFLFINEMNECKFKLRHDSTLQKSKHAQSTEMANIEHFNKINLL